MEVPKIVIKDGVISSNVPIEVETDEKHRAGKNVTITTEYCTCEKPFQINRYCVNNNCYKLVK